MTQPEDGMPPTAGQWHFDCRRAVLNRLHAESESESMVINDRHRFIFIHVPKSAGTSMMRVLQDLPGNNRRWCAVSNHEPIRDFQAHWSDRRSLFDRILQRSPANYLTCAFVRNPWDRLASLYRYLTEKKHRKPGVSGLTGFADFLDQAAQGAAWINSFHSFRNQVDFFEDAEGRMAIDFVGHYEHLADDVAALSDRLGVPIRLPHLNRSSHTGRDYRHDYSDRLVEFVQERFTRDVDQFGYEFDQPRPRHRCTGPLRQDPGKTGPAVPG